MKLIKYFTIAIAALAFAACGGDDSEGGKQNSSGVVLKANNNSVEVNTPISFTVTASDGADLTAEAIIYDYVMIPPKAADGLMMDAFQYSMMIEAWLNDEVGVPCSSRIDGDTIYITIL